MKIRTSKEIGLYVREHRRILKMTQAQLAKKVGVSRVWLSEFENGKETVEIGLALQTLFAVGAIMDITEIAPIAEGEIDLRKILKRYTKQRE